MEKRTQHFIQDPPYFALKCDKCKGDNIAWSEFESHLWCYDCQEDVECNPKADFYPIACSRLIGFDLSKWDMVNKRVIEPEEYIK